MTSPTSSHDDTDFERERAELARERAELLTRIANWLELPMLVLGFVWLLLVGVELLWPEVWDRNPIFNSVSNTIWIIFIVNFVIEFSLAPRKRDYLINNWLTVLSLLVPALRVFRVVRAVRALRVVRLVRVVGSLNRGMNALGASMSRRGFGYVAALTAIVTLTGAAGMYAFENHVPKGLTSYGEALWWTAMLMTTMGSSYWPESPEGRVLCVILAMYAFAVFGYVTAALATYFVGRDADAVAGEVAGSKAIAELTREVAALRVEIAQLAGARQLARGE